MNNSLCKNCGKPIVFRVHFVDGEKRWVHVGNEFLTDYIECDPNPPIAEPSYS